MSEKETKKADSGLFSGGFWAIAYGLISIAITLNNKAVLSTYKFQSTMTLTLLQNVVTIASLSYMKKRKYIDFPDFDWKVARKVAPLSFVFISYVVISLVALGRVNVPMFTALRRLTILFVMLEEYYFLGVKPNGKVLQTVAVMTLGAGIAAWKDITFDLVSYFFLFLTNLFTSLYTVFINVVKKETKLDIWSMMYYNSVTTFPVLLLIAIATGDLQKAMAFKHYGDIYFQLNFQASIWLAFLLNLATFYCTTMNSARTQTVVGQIKNFFAFLLGLVLFDDYIYDRGNFVGLLIGFSGSVWYSMVTFSDKKKGPAAGAGAGGSAAGEAGAGASISDKTAGGAGSSGQAGEGVQLSSMSGAGEGSGSGGSSSSSSSSSLGGTVGSTAARLEAAGDSERGSGEGSRVPGPDASAAAAASELALGTSQLKEALARGHHHHLHQGSTRRAVAASGSLTDTFALDHSKGLLGTEGVHSPASKQR